MLKKIKAAFVVADEWVQDPAGLVTIFIALFLVASIYMGLSRLVK